MGGGIDRGDMNHILMNILSVLEYTCFIVRSGGIFLSLVTISCRNSEAEV